LRPWNAAHSSRPFSEYRKKHREAEPIPSDFPNL
jgi:hypothetical protein